ncbi:MAG: tRNA (adenosine(37)-N6)-dimethylallyltransferase MiaA [Roseibium sp.]|uniref:tRNA (adenosine(37)-N6)-dimethylallyltransferase MiaA n=1 Tax=Roseibium sp. TaxID=1936156 RepID=UPI00261F275F|nr:tRNA (adenosine(37)-N6)-dimethylallyltransferase MiaA [Roseibium sp.]MCV0428777.1 tRNA (adenosine(37)-N6)-dimethylallyltransferase MiaA [Roseibium sp.]
MNESLAGDQERTNGKRAILIAGPTASGKSALALKLAKDRNGVILNADSMQLYEDLRLVSARPSLEDEAAVPHRLYGVLPASKACSTGEWLRMISDELDTVWSHGNLPVLVGGTGLYFKGLTEGFAELPEISIDHRREARELADREGVEGLKAALVKQGDAQAAASLNDPQRLARALEVVISTGKPLSLWQSEQQSAPLLRGDQCIRIVLAPPRPWLHERIAQRSRLMLSVAGQEEVRLLLEQGLSPSIPAMRAIGVAEIGAYLLGETDLEETIHRLTVATRQYAKRQETWFRNQMADWQRFDPSAEIDLSAIHWLT